MMHLLNFLALGLLTGPSSALIATFDTSGINLSNYMSASFPNFTVVAKSQPQNSITPESGNQYIQASASATQDYPANGTLLLNAHSSYGHLTNYYFACYSPAAFVASSQSCNQTMYATCYNLSNQLEVFTLLQQYTRTDNKMDLIDLTGFYAYYAQQGYFSGTGSAAKCIQYGFHAVNSLANSVPVGFYIDNMNYTVTT